MVLRLADMVMCVRRFRDLFALAPGPAKFLKLRTDTAKASFSALNLSQLLDEQLAVCAGVASFWRAMLQLTLCKKSRQWQAVTQQL